MMKKILFILPILMIGLSAISQSPDLMSYQSVIRNSAGGLIIEKPVGIKVSILQKTNAGVSVYTEGFDAKTNANGLVTLQIGSGTIVSGNISAIDWSDGPYFLKTEIDPNGGNAFSITNVSQLLSTPYALFAKSSGDAWKLSGNVATANSFMGTTNSQPLVFKINNKRVGYLNENRNIFWGIDAGLNNAGLDNLGIGFNSLNKNTTGAHNVAYGSYALAENYYGDNNTATGDHSLSQNQDGDNNTAYGSLSLNSNTGGANNVANGYKSLYTNTNGNYNTAIGVESLTKNLYGANNTAVGYQALYSNTTSNANTATGYQSLYANTTGALNVAYGYGSMNQNTIGSTNIGIGAYSLSGNKTGDNNIAIGYQALVANAGGSGNSANGFLALSKNTEGNNNIANGNYALSANITGSNNLALGSSSLFANSTGTENIGIGNSSGSGITSGSKNTLIGTNADVSISSLTNGTAIGYGAIVNANNKVRIGNTSVTKIEGQVAFSFPSDARFKYNIQHNVPGLDFIKKLQPVTYYFDNEKLDQFTKTGVLNNSSVYPVSYKGEKELHTGFLAQDVEKTANELGYHFDGVRAPENDKDHYSIAYSQFIMPLVKGMQEQQYIIDQQNKIIEQLNKTADQQAKWNEDQAKHFDQLKDVVKELKEQVQKLSKK